MAEEEEHLRSVIDYPTTEALRQALLNSQSQPSKGETLLDSSSLAETAATDTSSGSTAQAQEQDDSDNHGDHEPLDQDWDWVLTNYDVGTTKPQSVAEELLRLQTLQSYLVLDAPPQALREAEFDRFTDMASRVFKVPIALISVIDIGRQWFLSNHGLGEATETPRKVAFCAHAIQGTKPVLLVPDATKDPVFCDMGAVTGPPHVKFYAGAPLLSPEGYKLGTFCLVDTRPRHDLCEPHYQAILQDYAALTMQAMVTHRRKRMAQRRQFVADIAHDILTPIMGLQLALSGLEQEEAQEDTADSTSTTTHTTTPCLPQIVESAMEVSEYLNRVSQTTLDTLKAIDREDNCHFMANSLSVIRTKEFAATLQQLLQASIPPHKNQVQLRFQIENSVPPQFVSDELKLLRSALCLLSNALHSHTEDIVEQTSGDIQFRIFVQKEESNNNPQRNLIFECTDPPAPLHIPSFVDPKKTSTTTALMGFMGLDSVALQMESLGGTFGRGQVEPTTVADQIPKEEVVEAKTRRRRRRRRRSSAPPRGIGATSYWFSVPLIMNPRDIMDIPSQISATGEINQQTPIDFEPEFFAKHATCGIAKLVASTTCTAGDERQTNRR